MRIRHFFFFLRSVTKFSCAAAHAWGVRWQHVVKRAMADFPKNSSLVVSMDILKTNTLKTHTDPHTVRGRPTLKDVERFRNRSVHELIDNIIYRMLCFMKTVLQRFMSYTLISHTNAHAQFILVSDESYPWWTLKWNARNDARVNAPRVSSSLPCDKKQWETFSKN